MENSIYRGSMVCTYELKDESGFYYEDRVLQWKEAAARRELHCVDCGEPVYLAAGPIKEPYFAHYDIGKCEYESVRETEEMKKGKRLMYQLLKRSFPEHSVQARYRLENGMYCTLYCDIGDQPIVIDYRLINNSLEKFRIRNDFYQTHRIRVIYILGKRQDKDTIQPDWYQSLIQNTMGYLAFLDTEKEMLALKRSFRYYLGKVRHYSYCTKAYPLHELFVDEEGEIQCDFNTLCNEKESQLGAERLQYAREQEKLAELRDERLRLEQEEQIRMETYRRLQERKLTEQSNHIVDMPQGYTPKERSSIFLAEYSDEEILAMGLNITLYHKCMIMIRQGEGHLVAKKYYEMITNNR